MGKLKAVDLKRTTPGLYNDGDGLYLQVRPGKRGPIRSWILRYVENGRQHDMGLGPVRFISLAEARKATWDAQRLRLQGIDPLQHRRSQAMALEAITFGQCAADYFEANAPAWRNVKHRRTWLPPLQELPFAGTPVHAVDVAAVIRAIEKPWRKTPVATDRLRNRIEQVLAFAIAREYRTGPNPAAWERLKHVLPSARKLRPIQHFKAMPWAEVPGFMAELRGQDGARARALEFLILTASRSGEVRGARWEEFDGDVWTVPASRMKAGKEHRVPLPPRCLEILEARRRLGSGAFVFGGERALGVNALTQSLKGRCTTHGFRSAFRDWCGEATNYPREIAEAALAHQIGSAVEQAYRRGDALAKRRKLMEAWAAFCARPVGAGATVTPMRAVP